QQTRQHQSLQGIALCFGVNFARNADTSGPANDVYELVRTSEPKRTKGISTSDIITTILKDYNQYIMWNLTWGYNHKDLGISYVKSEAECSVDLKLGGLGEIGAADRTTTKEPVAATAAPSATPMKRPRLRPGGAGGAQCPSCAVDGCKADLSKCRDYHRRHKVCETHSKTPIVVVTGREMRFCQQCS
ncbi:hypothetical protein ACJX0J_039890, partial [Zea mays]